MHSPPLRSASALAAAAWARASFLPCFGWIQEWRNASASRFVWDFGSSMRTTSPGPGGGRGEVYLAVVDSHDLPDDGETQAAAAACAGVEPNEAIEHVVATVFRNSRAIVLDLQADAGIGGLAHPNGDARPVGTVAECVVDQVVEDLAEQGRVALRRPGSRPRLRTRSRCRGRAPGSTQSRATSAKRSSRSTVSGRTLRPAPPARRGRGSATGRRDATHARCRDGCRRTPGGPSRSWRRAWRARGAWSARRAACATGATRSRRTPWCSGYVRRSVRAGCSASERRASISSGTSCRMGLRSLGERSRIVFSRLLERQQAPADADPDERRREQQHRDQPQSRSGSPPAAPWHGVRPWSAGPARASSPSKSRCSTKNDRATMRTGSPS